MDYNRTIGETVQERIKSIRSVNDFTANVINLIETNSSNNIEEILKEYRYATELLLTFVEDPSAIQRLKEVELHVQKACKMALNKAFEIFYDRYENYYERLTRISRFTNVARKSLLRLRTEMDAARIYEKVAAIEQIEDFDEYTKQAVVIQKSIIEISRLTEIALVECEKFVKDRRKRAVLLILAIILGGGIGIAVAVLIGW
ncbi:MAG: hypothetical protein E7049_00745 [Lentisphaerae bacterium]|nr:hypothetical protein [Lentisphaerota bacterium]